MKNKLGISIGFVFGVTSFLLMFKFFILVHIPPSDELAPGMVVIASVLPGLVFAILGSRIQSYYVKKSSQQGK